MAMLCLPQAPRTLSPFVQRPTLCACAVLCFLCRAVCPLRVLCCPVAVLSFTDDCIRVDGLSRSNLSPAALGVRAFHWLHAYPLCNPRRGVTGCLALVRSLPRRDVVAVVRGFTFCNCGLARGCGNPLFATCVVHGFPPTPPLRYHLPPPSASRGIRLHAMPTLGSGCLARRLALHNAAPGWVTGTLWSLACVVCRACARLCVGAVFLRVRA